jgi:hypothetical protein
MGNPYSLPTVESSQPFLFTSQQIQPGTSDEADENKSLNKLGFSCRLGLKFVEVCILV